MKTTLNIPQVENLQSSNGNDVPNQFRIITKDGAFFKSYSTIIAAKLNDGSILLDAKKWNYSRTTSKYRNDFLGMTTKETEKLIGSGELTLTDLN